MDGGSTDGSLEIIRKYERWIAYWKSEPDGGQYAAIQKGFERSSGEIMAWLNSDDLYFPWTLHTVIQILFAFPNLRWISTSSLSILGSKSGLFDISKVDPYNRRDFFSQDFIRRPLVIQQEATFWRRELWNQAGAHLANDLNFAGDFELWTRFWKYEDLAMTPTPLAMFRFHDQQKTSDINGYIEEVLAVLNKLHRPFPVPRLIMWTLTSILKRIDPSRNWFGTRTTIIYLDNQKGRWIKVEYFSFKGAIKALLYSLVDNIRKIMHTDLQHVWSSYNPNKGKK
jgi:glycosyltransferase involved in cell wall biosynthesis